MAVKLFDDPEFSKALKDERFRISAGLCQARSDEAMAWRARDRARDEIRTLAAAAEQLNPVLRAAGIEEISLAKHERSNQPFFEAASTASVTVPVNSSNQ